MGEYPKILSVVNIDGNMVFKSNNYPGTFIFDKSNSKVRLIDEPDMPYEWNVNMFSDCVLYDNKVVFVPDQDADYISILDTENMKFTYIDNPQRYRYKKGFVYGKYVYVFGEYVFGGHILRIDMDELCVELDMFEGQSYKQKIIFNNTHRIGNMIYATRVGGDEQYKRACKFDLENETETYIDILGIDEPVLTICNDGEFFWLSGSSNKIFFWDEKNNTIKDTINLKAYDREYPWDFWFTSSEVFGDYVYFAPAYHNKMIRIDRKTHEAEELFEITPEEVCWSICKIDEKRLYVDISHYNTKDARNYVFYEDGTYEKDNDMFILEDLYMNEINESKISTLKAFVKHVVDTRS